MATKISFGNTAIAICAAVAAAIATSATFSAFADSVEQRIGNEATLWLDASDISTITTNASGEVTRWNSRVGSNYAKQSTHYQGVAMPYPRYDATTYGVPTVDFGEAKTDGGWSGTNLGMDLRLNETVPTKTVFWVARMKDAGNVAWMGINGFDTPFRRGDNGQYAMIPNAKFVNFWNGQDVVTDMANDHPPADVFCVYSAQMDDSATYNAEYLASQCLGLHSGGKQLSELIIFNQALSDGDRIEVTKYLQRKWAKSRTAPIAHRWSFNGTTDVENFTDSVGGVEGKMRHHTGTTTIADGGTVNWTNGKASLPGGAGAGYLNLGQGVLGTGNAVTLELWVTKDVNPSTWANLFAYNKEDEKKLITISANLGASNKNNINKIESSVGFNYQVPADDPAVIPLNGTYHYAITFLANGSGGTVVRWVIHDAATGLLKGDLTYTANSWTLADATSWSLTLGSNPWLNNTYEMKASYDEVRVWNGVLGDEQLKVNAMTGPDASPDAAMTSSAGFALATNATFHVNSDYTTAGTVILGEGSKLQFNGPAVFTALGGISIPSGELADYVVADTSLYNVIINGDVITVTSKAGSASWTGAGRAGDVTDPNNWDCRDGFDNVLPGELPSAVTAVTVSGTGINLQAPVGTTLQCASFTVRSCTFAADCDWRGLPVTPSLAGTADLNGHDLRLSHLTANSGAAIANGGTGISGIVFDAMSGSYDESSYVDGVSNLGTSENARIIILRNGDDSMSSLDVGNTANVWTEVRMASGTIAESGTAQIVNTANARGVLTVDGADVTVNALNVPNGNKAGTATLNVHSGSFTVTTWTDFGNSASAVATFNQTGGTVDVGTVRKGNTGNGNFWFGRNNSGTATYNMRGGTFTSWGSFRVGSSRAGNVGIFNQSGGTVNVFGTDDFTLAYDTPNSGKSVEGRYFQTGGILETAKAITVGKGNNTKATLDVGGTFTQTANGAGITLANGSGSDVNFALREGGVLTTSFLKMGSGTAHATFAGGKIVAKDASNASTFISGIRDVTYAAGGLTVDTAGYNVSMANNTASASLVGSAFVKQGAGTLTVDSLPPVDAVKVEAGTLRLSTDGDNSQGTTKTLAHRWSFNGDYNDSVGNVVATQLGNAMPPIVDGEVVMPGGNGAGSLSLGTGTLGTGEATIEIWATQTTLQYWHYIFGYGVNDREGADMLAWAWRNGANSCDNASLDCTGVEGFWQNNITELADIGTEYHFAITFTDNGDDTTTIKFSRRNSTNVAEVVSRTFTVANWNLARGSSTWELSIGHNPFSNSTMDASAKYNEVRVWHSALSDDDLAFSATLGPDATASEIKRIANPAACRTLSVASGATLDFDGHRLALPVLKGSGTVRGGLLDITDSLVVNLTDCIAGNCITASGTIDFTGAKLVFEDPVVLETHKGSIWLMRPTSGGSAAFIGNLEPASPLPTGWKISISASGARLIKTGLSIHLR